MSPEQHARRLACAGRANRLGVGPVGTTVASLVEAMERIAPPTLAAPWDNVGLLIGARTWPLAGVVLTNDSTQAVLEEARSAGATAVVSYHPPIFAAQKSLTDATPTGRLALAAAAAGIAVYSPHTALDAAPGGLGDWLAQAFGEARITPLQPAALLPVGEQTKLVTFCPAEAVAPLREALSRAGCGRIGDYEQCSFELRGQGTFLGGESTHPAIGERGVLERVDEVRLEMACSRAHLGDAVAALRAAHPYEEPPIEIHRLEARPSREAGQGRRVALAAPVDLPSVLAAIKRRIGVEQLRVAPAAAAAAAGGRVSCIGLCPGSGGELLEAAIASGCDVFFTGEMRHHDVLAARERGCTVVLAGHTNTERPYLPVLAERLRGLLPGCAVEVSREDRWPIEIR